jgi:hypothetical protein
MPSKQNRSSALLGEGKFPFGAPGEEIEELILALQKKGQLFALASRFWYNLQQR